MFPRVGPRPDRYQYRAERERDHEMSRRPRLRAVSHRRSPLRSSQSPSARSPPRVFPSSRSRGRVDDEKLPEEPIPEVPAIERTPETSDPLSRRMLYALEKEKNTDVIFEFPAQDGDGLDTTTFRAHKAVLSTGSVVFDKMFNGEYVESTSDEPVIIQDLGREAFMLLVKFIYAGELGNFDIPTLLLMETLVAAQKYLVEPLQEVCKTKMRRIFGADSQTSALSKKEMLDILESCARSASARTLLEDSLKSLDVSIRISDISGSDGFRTLPASIINIVIDSHKKQTSGSAKMLWESLVPWLQAHKEDKEDVGAIIEKIDFHIMDQQFFAQNVVRSGFINAEKATEVFCEMSNLMPPLTHSTLILFADGHSSWTESFSEVITLGEIQKSISENIMKKRNLGHRPMHRPSPIYMSVQLHAIIRLYDPDYAFTAEVQDGTYTGHESLLKQMDRMVSIPVDMLNLPFGQLQFAHRQPMLNISLTCPDENWDYNSIRHRRNDDEVFFYNDWGLMEDRFSRRQYHHHHNNQFYVLDDEPETRHSRRRNASGVPVARNSRVSILRNNDRARDRDRDRDRERSRPGRGDLDVGYHREYYRSRSRDRRRRRRSPRRSPRRSRSRSRRRDRRPSRPSPRTSPPLEDAEPSPPDLAANGERVFREASSPSPPQPSDREEEGQVFIDDYDSPSAGRDARDESDESTEEDEGDQSQPESLESAEVESIRSIPDVPADHEVVEEPAEERNPNGNERDERRPSPPLRSRSNTPRARPRSRSRSGSRRIRSPSPRRRRGSPEDYDPRRRRSERERDRDRYQRPGQGQKKRVSLRMKHVRVGDLVDVECQDGDADTDHQRYDLRRYYHDYDRRGYYSRHHPGVIQKIDYENEKVKIHFLNVTKDMDAQVEVSRLTTYSNRTRGETVHNQSRIFEQCTTRRIEELYEF